MFDRHENGPIVSSTLLVGVYKEPVTLTPNYEGFFNEVWNPKQLIE